MIEPKISAPRSQFMNPISRVTKSAVRKKAAAVSRSSGAGSQ
jgi:hypothetical protein